jgi:hypothetical protein
MAMLLLLLALPVVTRLSRFSRDPAKRDFQLCTDSCLDHLQSLQRYTMNEPLK